ncbi:endonuclease YncB(thermonuclease family) [Dyadobacter jejuensis]|uniref:Endonuclease YncB(Thermonuclease family) n=1 Tax=Dyadobacter jejuensis TaxID=1082580 RepID=A0A316AJX2_9BACT|nr:thermonuclease family protein [Dyadobacter jejuensis]PWJ57549.1 endonuclease YncB(thermonuclease family) [Dyadobacter jejuensis]
MHFTFFKTHRFLAVFVFIIFVGGSSPVVAQAIPKTDKVPNPLKAEVIAIQDGDTIELKLIYTGKGAGQRTGKPIRIRFLHINCPERGRPYYNVAKQLVADRCFRQTVEIRHKGEFDRYGRLLGEVVLKNGEVLNKTLVENGLAVHFKKYSSDQEYAALEKKAQQQKIGIWNPSTVNLGK